MGANHFGARLTRGRVAVGRILHDRTVVAAKIVTDQTEVAADADRCGTCRRIKQRARFEEFKELIQIAARDGSARVLIIKLLQE
ncbi:hypothetical protein LG047_12265 [Methylocystis sp. WRRC1]|uniref:hypothetical protein n=1 Tax=Methylocystis sp. WRRC1 TaxID=1732014 RepID=UPI001D15875C|nr:hypothetical protein [Methylocystis sp. WRRC1]MCC3246087.1 hypothetical protein [Methylocystis sp. WRRC1]